MYRTHSEAFTDSPVRTQSTTFELYHNAAAVPRDCLLKRYEVGREWYVFSQSPTSVVVRHHPTTVWLQPSESVGLSRVRCLFLGA